MIIVGDVRVWRGLPNTIFGETHPAEGQRFQIVLTRRPPSRIQFRGRYLSGSLRLYCGGSLEHLLAHSVETGDGVGDDRISHAGD